MKQYKLGATGRAWLKGFHIVFTAAWVGAMTCLLLLHLFARPADGAETHAVQAALRHLDDWVIIPSAMGSLLTGLLICWLNPWGFFKWPWVTLKALASIVSMFASWKTTQRPSGSRSRMVRVGPERLTGGPVSSGVTVTTRWLQQ
ncbi:MAG: hypothetical protein HGA45_22670 [Chloroflexales bacterium]|nr:hypothetical protein [Chloroflexales bacterium]